MSPSDAPLSDEPYCATASFSSAICRALTETVGFFERSKLLPDLEPLGPLLVAITAKVATLDEADRAIVADLHVETSVLHRTNGDGNGVALLYATGSTGACARTRRNAAADILELLHAEADALLLDIDVEDLRRDGLTLAVKRQRLLARNTPCDVRHVDHAIDVALEANEQTELGRVLDFALDG